MKRFAITPLAALGILAGTVPAPVRPTQPALGHLIFFDSLGRETLAAPARGATAAGGKYKSP